MRATAVVLNPDNDVLLVQHNGQDDWALPGGRIIVGEDPAHRAAVEVEEETGIHITQPIRVGHHAGTAAAHEIYVAQGSGEPRSDHREIQGAIWWDGVRPLRMQPHVFAILEIVQSIDDDEEETHLEPAQSFPNPDPEKEPTVVQPLAHMEEQTPTLPAPILPEESPVTRPSTNVEGRPLGQKVHRSDVLTPFIATAWSWVVIAALLLADWLIWVMLRIRSNERRIRPTRRVTWPKGLKQELMRRQDNTCVYCGHRRIARSLDIDHMVPAVRGGSNDTSNLQVICRPCNQRKGLQTDREFRQRYSRLVPPTPLTPPRRRVSQSDFKQETQRTSQTASVREFRRTRYISPREKIISGCFISGGIVAALVLYGLASIGAGGFLLLFPSLVLGGAVGFGIWLRAHMTGATSEDEG